MIRITRSPSVSNGFATVVFSYRPCGEFVGLSSRSGLCNSSACQCGHHLFALQVARALLSIATSKEIIRLEWSVYEFALFVSSAEMSVGEHRPVERPPLHGCIVNEIGRASCRERV